MLENLKKPERQSTCIVRTILYKLGPDDYQILTDALVDPEWSAAALATGLKENGIVIAPNSIVRHRKGGCSCGGKA
jgi:hypothetical protein